MKKLTVLLIVFNLIIILTGGNLLAADFGLVDDYQFMSGPLYTRPAMTEFTDLFEDIYGAMADENEALAELFEAFEDEDFEDAGITGFSFNHSTDYPSGPLDSFGFFVNLINTTEFGYRALLNYDLFRLDFRGRGSNELSLELDGEELDDYNEAELFFEYESEIDVEMLVHSLGAEYHFPFFSKAGNQVPDILRFFNLNVGGAYYWGSGNMSVSEYSLERFVGEDSEGGPIDQDYESSINRNYDLRLAGSPGYKVGVGFDYPIRQGMMVSAGANYRVLEMDIEASGNGDEIIGDMTEDFSGLEMKLGLFYQF